MAYPYEEDYDYDIFGDDDETIALTNAVNLVSVNQKNQEFILLKILRMLLSST